MPLITIVLLFCAAILKLPKSYVFVSAFASPVGVSDTAAPSTVMLLTATRLDGNKSVTATFSASADPVLLTVIV